MDGWEAPVNPSRKDCLRRYSFTAWYHEISVLGSDTRSVLLHVTVNSPFLRILHLLFGVVRLESNFDTDAELIGNSDGPRMSVLGIRGIIYCDSVCSLRLIPRLLSFSIRLSFSVIPLSL